ncbi:MAG: hypothetical protein KGI80_03965 [Verrucomicrobiota bacterium]|nr:hypothetical protein [Verrucomicrobiota bacterium]
MNIEEIKEFITKAKGFRLDAEHQKLLGYFEEFVELHTMEQEPGEKSEEQKRRLREAHNTFWNAFAKAASAQGISPQDLREKVEANAQKSQIEGNAPKKKNRPFSALQKMHNRIRE